MTNHVTLPRCPIPAIPGQRVGVLIGEDAAFKRPRNTLIFSTVRLCGYQCIQGAPSRFAILVE